MSQLPSAVLKRTRLTYTTCLASKSQQRNASLLRRPHRPYTFTQLVTLSDGSTYLTRTTSPLPIYKSTKDTRNHPLWQPSLDSLRNVEQDEAGRLRAFRERFGRGWDLDGAEAEGGDSPAQTEEDSLMDLISGGSKVKEIKKEKAVQIEDAGPVKMVTVKNEQGQLVKVPWIEDKSARKAIGKKK